MVPQALTCPYCNASVPLAGSPEPGQRIRCPRCEELFPYRLADGDHEVGSPPQPFAMASLETLEPPAEEGSRRWSNRAVATTLLAVMGIMAALGLSYALATKAWRRQHDRPSIPTEPEVTRVVSVAPARLAALGYLPVDTDVLAGLHIAELTADPATRGLLPESRPGSNQLGAGRLEAWIGLPLDDLDHAVLGLRVRERLLPRVILVVRTRQPYDAARVQAALHAGRQSEHAGKVVYRFTPRQSSLEAALWCADDRTLVIAPLAPDDLDDVPRTPTPGSERFAPAVRKLLDRMVPGTQAWLVGQVSDWEKSLPLRGGLNLLLPGGEAPQGRELLAKVQSLAAGLQIGPEVDAQVELGCASPAAAQQLDQALAGRLQDPETRLKTLAALFGQQPRAEPLVRDLAGSLSRRRLDSDLTLAARASLPSLRQALHGE